MERIIGTSEDAEQEAVAQLRSLFAPAAARLSSDIGPAFVYALREMTDDNTNAGDPDYPE